MLPWPPAFCPSRPKAEHCRSPATGSGARRWLAEGQTAQASPGRTLALRSSDPWELSWSLRLSLESWQSPAGPLTVTADIKNFPRVGEVDRQGFVSSLCLAYVHRELPGPRKMGPHSLQGFLRGGGRICMGEAASVGGSQGAPGPLSRCHVVTQSYPWRATAQRFP